MDAININRKRWPAKDLITLASAGNLPMQAETQNLNEKYEELSLIEARCDIITEIAHYLQRQSQIIEEELDRLVPMRHGPYQVYLKRHVMHYSGGKRMRPILTLTTTQILGGDHNLALSPACALWK